MYGESFCFQNSWTYFNLSTVFLDLFQRIYLKRSTYSEMSRSTFLGGGEQHNWKKGSSSPREAWAGSSSPREASENLYANVFLDSPLYLRTTSQSPFEGHKALRRTQVRNTELLRLTCVLRFLRWNQYMSFRAQSIVSFLTPLCSFYLEEPISSGLPGGTNFFWLPSPNRINLEEPVRVASPTRIKSFTWRNPSGWPAQPG